MAARRAMRCVAALAALLLTTTTPARGQTSGHAPTTVVILGAEHSAQLVDRNYHPGYFRLALARLHPAAICIEQPPDEFARNVFYFEATYEQQYVAVPFARARHVELCPVDWIPSRDDERLAFGRLEVVDPPPIRPASGFQSFMTLDSAAAAHTLFFADSEPWRRRVRAFFDTPQPGTRDFPRRLDLYRTYMQAMRIRSAALAHPGDTLLVVIGAMHKVDLERLFDGDPAVRIVQPSALMPPPDSASATAALTDQDRYAIATFNLLGVQSTEGPVDWPWVESILATLERQHGRTPELRLLRTRLDVMRHGMTPAAAVAAYESVARDSAANVPFTWNGVQDARRIDSYFDPFGNLTVRDRAFVEAARSSQARGDVSHVQVLNAALRRARPWSPLQAGERDVYWDRYVARDTASARGH